MECIANAKTNNNYRRNVNMPSAKKIYKDQEKYRKLRNGQRRRNYQQTQGNSPRPWTPLEEQAALEHRISDRELSDEICRSVEAIQIKRSRLKREMRKSRDN